MNQTDHTTQRGIRRIKMLASAAAFVSLLVIGACVGYGLLLGWDVLGRTVAALLWLVVASGWTVLAGVMLGGSLWEAVTEESPPIGFCLLCTAGICLAALWLIGTLIIAVLLVVPASVYAIGVGWLLVPGFVGLLVGGSILVVEFG